jgi:anti-sigma B factor antagonist
VDDAPAPFGIEVHARGGHAVVVVRGELDAWTAPDLARVLTGTEQSAGGEVEIDLGDVGFIDSSGILVLVRTGERLAAAGRPFSLGRVSAQVRRVLTLTGLADHFGIEPSSGRGGS